MSGPVFVEPTGSRLDDVWSRLTSTPLSLRLWRWGTALIVLFVAAVLRLWNLGNPHSLVFDETFYVKDAWSLWNNGYETTWPDKADEQFVSGATNIFHTDPSFVVHPPLGKWLIALGMALFGPENSFGWRFSTAIAGVLLVALVMLIALLLFRSTVLMLIAGGLLAIDGHAIVLSRVGLLDNFVALFTLLGVFFVLLDRLKNRQRLAQWISQHPESMWGPAAWNRPWLIAAGASFGLACAVKWSGLYFLAAFAIYVLVMEAIDRKKAGLSLWFSGTVLKQGPVTFILMVPIALVSYVASWSGWILTSGGYYRNLVEGDSALRWTGALSWMPDWVQNLWAFHVSAYQFHVGLTTPHSYQSNPLTWLLMTRPTSMFYEGASLGQSGCTFDACASAITPIANPLIWWSAAIAVFYVLYRLIRYRTWSAGFILMGMLAGYVPWLMYMNRTVFQFYGIIYEPYMILALTFAIGIVLGKKTDTEIRRTAGIAWVCAFLFLAILLSIFFYPLWSAMQIPYWYWHIHMWLPGWV